MPWYAIVLVGCHFSSVGLKNNNRPDFNVVEFRCYMFKMGTTPDSFEGLFRAMLQQRPSLMSSLSRLNLLHMPSIRRIGAVCLLASVTYPAYLLPRKRSNQC